MLPDSLKKYLEQTLSSTDGKLFRIISHSPVGGGCINHTLQLETSSGKYFLKWNVAENFPGMFDAEAKGLELLRTSGTLKIPGVFLSGEVEGKSFLLMEFVEAGKRSTNFWTDFGERLAALHRNTSPKFGLDHDNYIGSLPQSNSFHQDWIDFFMQERLEKQFRLAVDNGIMAIPQQLNQLNKALINRIPKEAPSLLHGDLWNGNYLVDENGNACLVDPAVYYGHREMDLAMTRLFGGFDPEFFEAYEMIFPLEPGFEERTDLHNLYPLMVHVNLFGGGYVEQVKQILKRL